MLSSVVMQLQNVLLYISFTTCLLDEANVRIKTGHGVESSFWDLYLNYIFCWFTDMFCDFSDFFLKWGSQGSSFLKETSA